MKNTLFHINTIITVAINANHKFDFGKEGDVHFNR